MHLIGGMDESQLVNEGMKQRDRLGGWCSLVGKEALCQVDEHRGWVYERNNSPCLLSIASCQVIQPLDRLDLHDGSAVCDIENQRGLVSCLKSHSCKDMNEE